MYIYIYIPPGEHKIVLKISLRNSIDYIKDCSAELRDYLLERRRKNLAPASSLAAGILQVFVCVCMHVCVCVCVCVCVYMCMCVSVYV